MSSQDLELIYLSKLKRYTDSNNDSLLFYANKLKKSENICYKYQALNYEVKAYYQNEKVDIAEQKSKSILNDLKSKDEYCLQLHKLRALNTLFWIYKNKKSYQKAFKIALRRKEISESLPKNAKYEWTVASVNNNIAIVKNAMGFHEEARVIFKRNFKLLPSIYNEINNEFVNSNGDSINKYNFTLNQTSVLNLIGESYLNSSTSHKSKDLDSASVYFNKAYKISQNFNPPHKDSETLYQLREAEVLAAKKQFVNSLELINLYSENSKEFNTSQKINALKAICYHNLKINDSAIFYARKYIEYYKKDKHKKDRLIAIYDILSNQYYQSKKLDSAFKYSELTIKELNLLDKNKNQVNKDHYLHNYDDINNLNQNILIKEKKKNFWFGVIAVLTSLVLIWIVYFFRKNKAKAEKELETLKEKNNTEKIDYNIDQETEAAILKGIADFENSKGFLNQNFTIKILAKKLKTNTSYLSYVFNKKYNQSFKQYITQLRIDYIIKELKENSTYRNYTVQALAEEVGYTNASAFTRAFKKHTGITPSEFIKSLS